MRRIKHVLKIGAEWLVQLLLKYTSNGYTYAVDMPLSDMQLDTRGSKEYASSLAL